MSTLPPDRGHIATEQRHTLTRDLHTRSVGELLSVINRDDVGVAHAVGAALPAIETLVCAAEPGFVAGGRLVYVGAGTSGRLGVLDASEAPPTFCVDPGRVVGIIAGGDSALRVSSESKEDDPNGSEPDLRALGLTDRDTVIAIAAGGTTPYALGALAIAKRLAPRSVTALLCCASVQQPSACDHLVVVDTGPEVVTGSTRMKAGTATKMVLNMISTTLMIREGRVFENLMVDMRATNSKLRDRAARIVSMATGLSRDQAFRTLDRAGGEVKTAILLQRAGLSAEEARQRLRLHKGRLDRALEEEAADDAG